MSDSNDLKTATYRALAEFRYQLRRFLRFSEEVARKAGLEPQHHQLMLALKGIPAGQEPRIAYLAERLQLRHHSAVELVDRLAKKGLIRRSRGEIDRREVHVKLTPRGDRILQNLTLHTRAELRSAAPTLVSALRNVMAGSRSGNGLRPSRAASARGIPHRRSAPPVAGRKRAIRS